MNAQGDLDAQDRCDRCGARALVAYDNGLMFCAHHDKVVRTALGETGVALVVDNTSALVAEETQSPV